jgi:hypothetical protein
MPVAKITGQGLFAIALSVTLLWSCIVGERVLVHHAGAERVRILQEMDRLQRLRRPIPATTPLPTRRRRFVMTDC